MSDEALLERLESLGVKLRAVGHQLVVDAPRGAVSAALANEIRARKDGLLACLARRRATEVAVPRVSRDRPLRLGVIQQRMWLHSVLEPETVLYHLPAAWRFVGNLDKPALNVAFSRLIERQEALRTVIDASGDDPVMTFTPPRSIRIQELDLSDVADERRNADMIAAFEEARDAPFDFEEGPLYRAMLAVCGPEDHVLFFMPHHVIWDGWSFDIFLRELAELYAAEVEGRHPELPELTVQYADYALWHRDWLSQGHLDEQIAYWDDKLKGPLPVLDLPTDHPRPPYFTHAGDWEPFIIDETLTRGLRGVAREQGATLVMVLLAAWNVFLSRYSGQEEILVGAPIQNRMIPESEGLIGPFVNTVVLRCDVSRDATFRELLDQVRETSIDAFSRQEVPVELLIERLMHERSTSHTPLFQAMFSHQQIMRRPDHFADLALSQVHLNPAASAVDLTFAVMEDVDHVRAVMHYSTDLYDAASARRFCGHLIRLLESIVEDADQQVGALAMLADDELEDIQRWGRGPALDLPGGACLHTLIADRARANPDAVALVGEDGASLTYAQMEAASGRLAGILRGRGVGPGAVVGVSLPRTPELVVALLAILEAGAAYLPLDPDHPDERLSFIARDAGMSTLVTRSDVAIHWSDGKSPVILLDDLRQPPTLPDAGAAGSAESHDVAYLIYTSGSTGRPKGVEVTHENAVNFLLSMVELPGLSLSDVMVAVTTLSFDIAVLELFAPLVAGGTVVVASGDTCADGVELRSLMERVKPTVMQATPATWRMLLDAGWEGDDALKVLVGGEALPAPLAGKLAASCGEVWNMYGPTETTVWSTCWRVPRAEAPIRIGAPIANTTVYVLDESLERVPVGVNGELYIGGLGVARGYRNRPDLTAERFLPDPFSARPGARMYRTGDLVRFHRDGTLEYVRRLDDQVKVRGFRIELGEIEAVLRGHEAVAEGFVRAFEPGTPNARLVAYIVVERGASLTGSEIRRYLARQLPRYMVPGFVVELDEVPRTPNRKVDRNALPDPLTSGTDDVRAFEAPTTEFENMIARVWKDVLEVERVGRHDNFFELGGHSLLSLRAVSAIEDLTGLRLDPRAFFFQTVEQLGTQLEEAGAQAHA